jgi:hypothetical protein
LADSYYEYLVRFENAAVSFRSHALTLALQIKQAQLISDAHPQYSRMYTEAIDSAYEHLIARVEVVPGREDLTTIGVKVRVSPSFLASLSWSTNLTPSAL